MIMLLDGSVSVKSVNSVSVRSNPNVAVMVAHYGQGTFSTNALRWIERVEPDIFEPVGVGRNHHHTFLVNRYPNVSLFVFKYVMYFQTVEVNVLKIRLIGGNFLTFKVIVFQSGSVRSDPDVFLAVVDCLNGTDSILPCTGDNCYHISQCKVD